MIFLLTWTAAKRRAWTLYHIRIRHYVIRQCRCEPFGPELRTLIRLMFDTMYDCRGVGLAAPQLGLPLQVFVVNHTCRQKEGMPETEHDPKKEMVFINPTIEVKESRNRPAKIVLDGEGCLSMPGLYGHVPRPNTIVFEAVNEDQEKKRGEYNGMVARIIQHENDHLHGRLFIDHLDEKQKEGVPGWLDYLSCQFEFMQKFTTGL